MSEVDLATDTSIHTLKHLLDTNNFFDQRGKTAKLVFPERWLHIDPMGLSMIAAWGAWCLRNGKKVEIPKITKVSNYAARMKIFDHLKIPHNSHIKEREEAGRFMPVTNVRNSNDIKGVIADISTLLHLQSDLEALATVQYCMSELLRNVLEHSSSPDGAYVCAQNYRGTGPHRVTLAVADCGIGITKHLGHSYPEVLKNDLLALRMAMFPGITGALRGAYGTTENAGAGLFITRCIAKGLGGYFALVSGKAAYRLRRSRVKEQIVLSTDPFVDRSDQWELPFHWQGTAVAIEMPVDKIEDFRGLFDWIRKEIPPQRHISKKVRFT